MTVRLHKTGLIAIGALFCMANMSSSDAAASENLRKLSNEVVAAMQGNQAAFDSVRTLQATLTRKTTHSFGDKGSYRLVEVHRIRYDGNHFRKDQLQTKFTGKREYQRYGRAVRVGDVDIESAESNIDYIASNNLVFVRPPRWDNRYKIRTNDMLRYQSARGATLKENILASAKNNYYFTGKSEKVDGHDCVLLTCDYTDPDSTLKIWVVPSKGYCIKKVQDIWEGKVHDEYTTTLKQYPPGIWWFGTVQAKKTYGAETISSHYSVKALIFNEPIDPEIFTVWGMGLSPETKIRDEIRNTMYTLAIGETEASQKNAIVNPTNSPRRILVFGLGILALVVLASLAILLKGANR